jgi:hypothetical protein
MLQSPSAFPQFQSRPTVSVPSHSFSPVPQFRSVPRFRSRPHGFGPVPTVSVPSPRFRSRPHGFGPVPTVSVPSPRFRSRPHGFGPVPRFRSRPTVSVPSHGFSPVPRFRSRPTGSVPSHGFSPVPRVQSRPTGSVREAIRSAALRVAAYRGFVATRSRSSRAHRDHYPSRKRPSSQSYRRKTDSPRPSFYAHINNLESFSPRVGARLPPSLGRRGANSGPVRSVEP